MTCKKSKFNFKTAVKTLGLEGQTISVHNVYDAMVSVILAEKKSNDYKHLFACLEAGLWLMCKHFEQYISLSRTIKNNISDDINHPFTVKFIGLVVAMSDMSEEEVVDTFIEKKHNCCMTRTGYIQKIA
ncbi:hypothetical protein COT95_01585 [Candidatus Falkowbacteria bacterium CG10_big_fil_rev_8_21_14_0_10_37_6]|uniref:Uncharacterized protein n=1 Tax=Candidatus Falkowbacteria bacterium CG10_big_fil_rev_8_21_14_0_10_37_6 TaxID=1974563 RepID=A0A2H0V729_9BACT|nr:MAG: hypothetical protein COT95_01585 [Candidatus Falkowbacteria bacterium CG10_big_fil_rev_8_21_14_0_10_37_6]